MAVIVACLSGGTVGRNRSYMKVRREEKTIRLEVTHLPFLLDSVTHANMVIPSLTSEAE